MAAPAKQKKPEPFRPLITDNDPNWIRIRGARSNNLKNVDLDLPRNQLVVITGVSGSGKSSITMDTLYAEGQRRYVESLSAYARQFLMRMKKPDVDMIHGICPAIALEQKVSGGNNRSTVGSLTEIYDFLRMLYARIGRTYSPISGEEVHKQEVSDVIDYLRDLKEGTKAAILIPLPLKYADRTVGQELELLLQKGYTRLRLQGELIDIQDWLADHPADAKKKLGTWPAAAELLILIDRFVIAQEDDENWKRIADSALTAFQESEGLCHLQVYDGPEKQFSNRFEADGMAFLEPNPQLFNYNNSYGACPRCEGYGKVMGIDENKVIPDSSLSVYEGAVAAWRGEAGGEWKNTWLRQASSVDFPIHRPYFQLTREEKRLLWQGINGAPGVHAYFKALEEKTYKIQNRVMLARYRGRTTCPDCDGGRLRTESTYVRIQGRHIMDLIDLPLSELTAFMASLQLPEYDQKVAKRLLLEINMRLQFMLDVGLGYLTLNRVASTLSGGETQRINLTRILGSNLTSSLYILDEPSVGLHPRDTTRLIRVLGQLRDLGNTVVVVEHEEELIRAADYLVDMGPMAGIHGGEVVFAGPFDEIGKRAPDSLTTAYLNGTRSIPTPASRRKVLGRIILDRSRMHNLKNITVEFPLDTLTVVTGVSGSGKSTLVKQILYPALQQAVEVLQDGRTPEISNLTGDLKRLTGVEMINQAPIGRSSRSNPVTYVKAYDAIRELMADQSLSVIRGYKPKHFSFNVEGGRCETCKGEGEQVVEMQFLADVRLECDDCKGRRFKQEILEVRYQEKSIYDILSMTIEEALHFFDGHKDIIQRLKPLDDVGLGYVQLGQSSSTLSGGEAQRVKLASFLGRESKSEHIFFIFDEPTTGLHFHDIGKLLDALQALVEHGHTVLVVEHNMEVIKSADWIIDLGPEGGDEGGHLLFQGRPEDLLKIPGSYTGQYLKEKLKQERSTKSQAPNSK
ncbi:MAG: excinuclease ABC subunit UvrA [Saprospiraceae bacterium]|nr:excinuclease ABC subunit UvrA [Saprospiraceae bacterium]MCB9312185.1 excinuclease ABC subunit UvrA [Lewinellaceae bacterium]